MVRGLDRYVAEAVASEDATHRLDSVLGRVVLFAEMGQPDRLWGAVAAQRDRLGCRAVGQMAVGTSNAALEEAWVCARFEQVGIVVCFEDQQVEVAELSSDVVRHPAQVSRDRRAATASLDSKAERFVAIVGYREGLYVQLTDLIGAPGLNCPTQRPIGQVQCPQGSNRRVDRDSVFFGEISRRPTVVSMGMRQKNARQRVGVHACSFEEVAYLNVRSAALDQDGSAFALYEIAIAIAAGGKRPDPH